MRIEEIIVIKAGGEPTQRIAEGIVKNVISQNRDSLVSSGMWEVLQQQSETETLPSIIPAEGPPNFLQEMPGRGGMAALPGAVVNAARLRITGSETGELKMHPIPYSGEVDGEYGDYITLWMFT